MRLQKRKVIALAQIAETSNREDFNANHSLFHNKEGLCNDVCHIGLGVPIAILASRFSRALTEVRCGALNSFLRKKHLPCY